jgi:hypothetical protein
VTYVSWGVMYEGPSDRVYFDVLIPRLMEEIVLSCGTRSSTIPDFPAVVLTRGTVEKDWLTLVVLTPQKDVSEMVPTLARAARLQSHGL